MTHRWERLVGAGSACAWHYGYAKWVRVGLVGGERFADEIKLGLVVKSTGNEAGGLGIRRLTETHVGVVGK